MKSRQADDVTTAPGTEVPESTKCTTTESREEIDRFYNLLKPHVIIQGQEICIEVPVTEQKKKLYPLIPRNDKNDPLRAWIYEVYADKYPEVTSPRIQNYNFARLKIQRETDIPEPVPGSVPAPERGTQPGAKFTAGRKRGRGNPLQDEYDRALAEVKEIADLLVPAREIGVLYARVPYTENNPGLTGVWRLDPNKPYQLLDCAVYFKDLNRPHANSKSIDYSGTIRVVNVSGEERTFVIDRDRLEDKGLDAQLKGFASWPHMPSHKHWLLEALDMLMREKTVLIHDQQESLGWCEHKEYGLVWLANNGIETTHGFIPTERAPFIAPSVLVPGNGYRSIDQDRAIDPSVLNDEIWELFLEQLNPGNWSRLYGKLGAFAYLLYPEGTRVNAGRLEFAIETVGDGSGKGKSAEDNYVMSLYGVDFRYDLQPYLTADDTAPSRPKVMETVKYCLYADYDRKARPGNALFHKQHESRKQVVTQYADGTGGGNKMTAYGQKLVNRGNPQGGILLTGNFDHAPDSLGSEKEEDATEWRVCTFLLDQDETADDDVSRHINPRRTELTQWGTAFRHWLMEQYNQDKQALTLRLQNLHEQACLLVDEDLDRVWPHFRPHNYTVDLVAGALTWCAFLSDLFPEDYETRFLYQWFQTYTTAFIDNRYDRAMYIQSLIESRLNPMPLNEYVLDSIRVLLGSSQGYIVSQQDKILQPEDVPSSLSAFGMKHNQNYEGNELWSTGQTKIGYYLPRKDAIAFNHDLLYPLIEQLALKSKYQLPSKQDFKKKLAETGLPIVKRDQDGNILRPDISEKINGKSGWYITIPLRDVYPIVPVTDEDEDEDELYLSEADNVTQFRAREQERAQNVTVTVTETGTEPGQPGHMTRHVTPSDTAPVPEQDMYDPFDVNPDDVPEE